MIPAKGHKYTEEITLEAQCETEGEKTFTCACGDTYTEAIPATGHDYTGVSPVWSWYEDEVGGYTAEAVFGCAKCDHEERLEAGVTKTTTDATCTENGFTAYTATVEFENTDYTDHKDGIILANGHTYEATPVWNWYEDEAGEYTIAEAVFACTACDHEEMVEATVQTAIEEPTCTENGTVTRTPVVEFNGNRYTGDAVVSVLTAPGHVEVEDEAVDATCTTEGKTAGSHCKVCGMVIQEQEVIPATGHDYDEGEILQEPSCIWEGQVLHTCRNDESHVWVEILEKVEHTLVHQEAQEPTCTQPGHNGYDYCEICGEIFGREELPVVGHSYGAASFQWSQNSQGGWSAQAALTCLTCGQTAGATAQVSVVDETAPSCETPGSRTLMATAILAGQEYQDTKSVELPATGHTAETDAAVAPTCTETGLTRGSHCAVCGAVLEAQETVAAKGHGYGEPIWTWAGTSRATARWTCSACAEGTEGHTQTKDGAITNAVTKQPTSSTAGERTYTATVTLDGKTYTDQKTESIPATGGSSNRPSGGGGGGGGSFTQAPTPVEPTPVEPAPTPTEELGESDVPLAERPGFFEDVKEEDWFYTAVKYVYTADMMKGTSATRFSPKDATSRGMIVTVLHRMEKEPNTDIDASFLDVIPDEWYEDAVSWGAQSGIVKGYDNGNFGPMDQITREQLAAFLFRYAGVKGYDVSGRADLSGFADGQRVSDWALEAVQWAVSEGLLKGTGAGLNPQGSASRAETAEVLTRFVQAHGSAQN